MMSMAGAPAMATLPSKSPTEIMAAPIEKCEKFFNTFKQKAKAATISDAQATQVARTCELLFTTLTEGSKTPNNVKVELVNAISSDSLAPVISSVVTTKPTKRKADSQNVQASKKAATTVAATGEITEKEIAAARKRIAGKVNKAVKKTKHNDKKKPYSEVSEGIQSPKMALALMKGREPSSDSKKMTKWTFSGESEIAEVLGTQKLIHPVAFDGKVWTFGGMKPKIYAWAGFDSLEVKYDKPASLLTFKIRTFMFGSGSPESREDYIKYAKGEVGYDSD
eukprot:m.24809 g.24809  ORF g.24809 m.24809 type:complete len:280 (-) comp7647_c0_seq1:108-947(-)